MEIHKILLEYRSLGRRGPMKHPRSIGQYVSRALHSFSQKVLIGFF